jgi:hypothetical protein
MRLVELVDNLAPVAGGALGDVEAVVAHVRCSR